MAASERGDTAEAERFVPMAIEAYRLLPSLDRDAHYHLGLIALVAGDRAAVLQHADAMREGAPDNLLATVLEHKVAIAVGDDDTVSKLLADFSAVYDRERATARPEYQAHARTIDEFREVAARQSARSGTGATTNAAAGPTELSGSITVKLPADLPESARNGERLFKNTCAVCHGPAGSGSDQGPPLIHKIYEPGHHADMAFVLAVRHGVRAHHWKFGNMPPLPGVTDSDVEGIVSYIRAIQRANGIE